MSAIEALSGQTLIWDQGINSGGGFGQITPADYLVVVTGGFGDLSGLLGQKVTVNFGDGLGSGKTATTTVTAVNPGSGSIRVAAPWSVLGVTPTVGAFGTLSIGAAPFEPEEPEEPEEPGVVIPPIQPPVFGARDPFNTANNAATFAKADMANDSTKCGCDKHWLWLVVVAAVAYYAGQRK